MFFHSQVQFYAKSTVVRVATRGGSCCWVTSYWLAYSQDCTTFHNILDGAGNNQVIVLAVASENNCVLFIVTVNVQSLNVSLERHINFNTAKL